MAKLICVRTETCHANADGVAWYAYFESYVTQQGHVDGVPTDAEFASVFKNPALVESCNLGWDDEGEYEEKPEEVPNLLSRHTGLRRFYVSLAL